MEKFMNAETLCNDKKFIASQMRSLPKYIYGFLSKDEIKSDLFLTIYNVVNSKAKIAPSKIFNYIRCCFLNTLKNSIRDQQQYASKHYPLEYAHNLTYVEKDEEEAELCAYLTSLPDFLLGELTEFALGKKNKEEIIANPSLNGLNVDRVLEKLDCLLG